MDAAIQIIDEELAEIEKQLNALDARRSLLRELRVKFGGIEFYGRATKREPQPGKAVAPRQPESTGARKLGNKEKCMIALLDGPKKSAELARILGHTNSGNASTLCTSNEHLFKRTGNMFSPWTLTEEGIATAKDLKDSQGT